MQRDVRRGVLGIAVGFALSFGVAWVVLVVVWGVP